MSPETPSRNPAAFEGLLAALVPFERVVILSGDVHYGFAGTVEYRDRRRGRSARFVQCTSSALKNETGRTRVLGGVPTVARVPDVLGSRVEKLLSRLTTPPSTMYWLGWTAATPRIRRLRRPGEAHPRARAPVVMPRPLGSARARRDEPDWQYRIDFSPGADDDPRGESRSAALHQRALELRHEHGWAFMNCIVGRNNLGDIEFVPPADDRPHGTDGWHVLQSLWFDKTSISAGTEPERLPYTVYRLPLTPPAP